MKNNSAFVYILGLVSAFFILSCETAFEPDLARKKVTLLAPVNNLSTTDTVQTFYWERLNGASQYRLQVVSPRFAAIARLIEDTIINFDRFTIIMHTGNYQWRVRAVNNSSISDSSDTWNLTIQ